MSAGTIGLNYAEALFDLGEQSGRTAEYADLIDAVAAAIDNSPEVQAVLMSPRVPKAAKSRLLSDAMKSAPREFVLFLQAVVQRGRQGLLREIAAQYTSLVDLKHQRIRAAVTLARTPSPELERSITQALSRAMGKEVIATFNEKDGTYTTRPACAHRTGPIFPMVSHPPPGPRPGGGATSRFRAPPPVPNQPISRYVSPVPHSGRRSTPDPRAHVSAFRSSRARGAGAQPH